MSKEFKFNVRMTMVIEATDQETAEGILRDNVDWLRYESLYRGEEEITLGVTDVDIDYEGEAG